MTGGVGMVSSCYYLWSVVLVWSVGGNICDHWRLYSQQVVIPVSELFLREVFSLGGESPEYTLTQ